MKKPIISFSIFFANKERYSSAFCDGPNPGRGQRRGARGEGPEERGQRREAKGEGPEERGQRRGARGASQCIDKHPLDGISTQMAPIQFESALLINLQGR